MVDQWWLYWRRLVLLAPQGSEALVLFVVQFFIIVDRRLRIMGGRLVRAAYVGFLDLN